MSSGMLGSLFHPRRLMAKSRAIVVLRKEISEARARVADLEKALEVLGGRAVVVAKAVARKGRRKLSAAQKNAVSLRMRKLWAQRRKAKTG